MSDPQDERTFEEGLRELEEIVAKLEGGDLPLEESMELFERGIKLVRFCSSQLEQAEGRIQKLLEAEDGSPRLEDEGEEEES